MTDKKFLTCKELAKELSLNAQYVRDMARFGLIPAKKINKHWRFNLAEVEEKMEQNAAIAVQRSLYTNNDLGE